jgi:hypothetical protein
MKQNVKKFILVGIAALGLTAFGGSQIKQVIKILGVGVAVDRFGPDIDKQFDKLTNHTDTDSNYTKVVPIIGIGNGAKSAIGAAQIKGAKVNVDKVRAVASPEIELFGREIRLRAMIPVSTDKVATKADIKAVDGVGVSGIVDLKL